MKVLAMMVRPRTVRPNTRSLRACRGGDRPRRPQDVAVATHGDEKVSPRYVLLDRLVVPGSAGPHLPHLRGEGGAKLIGEGARLRHLGMIEDADLFHWRAAPLHCPQMKNSLLPAGPQSGEAAGARRRMPRAR